MIVTEFEHSFWVSVRGRFFMHTTREGKVEIEGEGGQTGETRGREGRKEEKYSGGYLTSGKHNVVLLTTNYRIG